MHPLLVPLYSKIDSGEPIILAGVSIGDSAKSAEEGKADLLITYNSGRYRMAGQGSLAGLLPYGDAHNMTLEMVREIAPAVKNLPIIAGVCATNPFRRNFKKLVEDFLNAGASGVMNFPTVSLIDGKFREQIEAQGMSYRLEVEMIRTAHDMGVLTSPYVFSEAEAKEMVGAGADIVIAHMGYAKAGLDDAVEKLQGIKETGTKLNPEIIILCHGGPIVEPADFEHVFKHVDGIAGFMGFSGIERIPSERAIKAQLAKFKSIRK